MAQKQIQRHNSVRLIKLDELIRANNYPSPDYISEHFEIDKRTVYRDIEALKDQLNAPVAYSKKYGGYYYTEKDFSLKKINLTEGELISIYLGEKLLRQYEHTSLGKTLRDAFEKVLVALGNQVSIDIGSLEENLSISSPSLRPENKKEYDFFQLINTAIKKNEKIDILYQPPLKELTKREVSPWHLRHMDGQWYMIGYCHLKKEERTFALSRIKNIKVLNIPGEKNIFDLEKFSEDRFGVFSGHKTFTIKLEFAPSITPWIKEKLWHPKQKLKEMKDGSIIMEFVTKDLREVKNWVLSKGQHVKVLSPKELKVDLKRVSQLMVKNFS